MTSIDSSNTSRLWASSACLVGVVVRADRDVLVVEVQHLARHGAAPDAEDGPAAGQVVQRGEVLGEAQRVPLRHDVEHRAEPEPRRVRAAIHVESWIPFGMTSYPSCWKWCSVVQNES